MLAAPPAPPDASKVCGTARSSDVACAPLLGTRIHPHTQGQASNAALALRLRCSTMLVRARGATLPTRTLREGVGRLKIQAQSAAYFTAKRRPSVSVSSPFVGRSSAKVPVKDHPALAAVKVPWP